MSALRINPKVDFAFRKLFGSEENKDLLMSLINSIVEPSLRLSDVVIKNPFNLAAYHGSKETILDIKAVDQDGVSYDLEMQLTAHALYGRRAVYYLSKLYADQLSAGEDYAGLHICIGIHLLDFVYFEGDDRVAREIRVQGQGNERDQGRALVRPFVLRRDAEAGEELAGYSDRP
jgi:predicted transposase/invertase (TIGR01784 family)